MRVAVVHNLTRGGAHRRLREQVARFPAPALEVCLAGATPLGPDAHVIPYAPLAPRLPALARPPLRYGDLWRLLGAWRQAARVLERLGADVVYANPCRFLQAPPLLSWIAWPSLYFCDEPRRVDHDPSTRDSRRRLTRGLYAPLHRRERRLDDAAARAATIVVTNSHYTASRIQAAYGVVAQPLTLGVDAAFRPSGEPPGDHLLSVGTLVAGKGHDLVIEAAALAARRRPVVIVAPRPAAGEQARLLALARARDVSLDVRVGIDDDELARLYAGAHTTLYLARNEPLGLASLEAQACGCPVIVAAEGGLPETIVDGSSGFAVARTAAAAAAALECLEQPARRAAMAAAACERAASLSWDHSSAEVWERLETLAAERSQRSGIRSPAGERSLTTRNR
jgi:glycosyltransferase involved in cell wall biosynthesis